jgi:hypothetical protein
MGRVVAKVHTNADKALVTLVHALLANERIVVANCLLSGHSLPKAMDSSIRVQNQNSFLPLCR